jgi:pyridinium-3,5-bisthiocarboxylic acid mononucleotide nickel chelatase
VIIGWLDCSSGISGDMLLGALTELDAVHVSELAQALPVTVSIGVAGTTRGGIRATAVDVRPAHDQPHRTLSDVLTVIDSADLPAMVKDRAAAVFRRLAAAEGRVHGLSPDAVEFHEVGAVDAIVDVVGACVGLHRLGLDELVVSPIALGGGQVETMHGLLPVPGPAVLELLRASDLISYGGPVQRELATPTGAAVLAEWATAAGPMPQLRIDAVGVGAGGRELAEQPNVLRLVVGRRDDTDMDAQWQVIAANVDDLDPRLWPVVIDRLLGVGAVDAWIAPIVMKKGRPAHTVHAMCATREAEHVRRVLFAETSTIGVRTTDVGKHALDREWVDVEVDGQAVRVKLARLGDEVVNVSPEFDDVVRAAGALGRPVKTVLAAASAAAQRHSK